MKTGCDIELICEAIIMIREVIEVEIYRHSAGEQRQRTGDRHAKHPFYG